ncbi:MAG: hypothetical protein HFG65_16825 [Hungatella sp.]|nr:hypothetical protein [Lachnospiraceae bacterium]MCI9362547.1 hypothetical protein [Hungatella sp.]
MIGIRISHHSLNEIKQLWCKWFFRKDRIYELVEVLEHDLVFRQMIFLSDTEYDNWKKAFKTDPSIMKSNLWREPITTFIFDDLSDETYVISTYKKKIQQRTKDFLFKNYERYRQTIKLAKIIQLIGVEVCPYCNRNFIENYVVRQEKGQQAYFKGDLDHHYAKEEIPALALSFFNLVPSCKVCNHEKSDSIKRTFYPFYDQEENEYQFRIEMYDNSDTHDLVFEEPIEDIEKKRFDSTVWQGISDHFKIKLCARNGKALSERMENSKEIFHLEKKYNHSKEYVKELIRKRYIYAETHKENLLKNFAAIFTDEKQIAETLYSYSDREEYVRNRPLSKLTKDLLIQLGAWVE